MNHHLGLNHERRHSMAYSELVKNFEKVRAYVREFYVYGFKSRSGYDAKSARSYDDERRRIESWLGDYMGFRQTSEGKNVFLSVDSRITQHNPFYRAWKTKSFTDGDITLHFILLDILHSPNIKMTASELAHEVDRYLSLFDSPMTFDESTIRKKLKEYTNEGIIQTDKEGRKVYYSRPPNTDLTNLSDVLDFFSEASPCGVIGSYLQDKDVPHKNFFTFKHHYMTQTMDSDIMAILFDAIQEKRYITADYLGKHTSNTYTLRLVPLKIYISAQNGRQNLIAYHVDTNRLNSYRLDYMSNIKQENVCDKFEELRSALEKAEKFTWGVNIKWSLNHTEHVEFDLRIEDHEQYIIQRLEREKRCGLVIKLDEHNYRFTADVFDTSEMLPWIRTFTARITRLNFSNRTLENRFKNDLREMYRLYGIDGGDL